MALRTPSHYDEKSYGKPDTTPSGDPSDPRVYKPSDTQGVYDDNKAAGNSSDPRASYNPQKTALGDPSDPRSKKLSQDELKRREDRASGEGIDAVESQEKELLASHSREGGLWKGEEGPSHFTKFRGRFTRRRMTATIVATVIGVGGIGGFSIIQGPLEFIHFAQSLQRFHLRDNEDFSNRRTIKLLQYTLSDGGVERTRLSVSMNTVADKWEKKLISQSGLRPVYASDTGRFAGYEIVDEKKARSTVGEWTNNGGEVRKISDAGRQGVRGTAKNVNLDGDRRFIDARDNKPRANRALITTVGKSTGTNNISSALGSRLLKQRGGVDFHPLKNLERKAADSAADRRAQKKQVREEAAARDRDGVQPGQGGTVLTGDQNGDNVDDTDPNAQQVSSEAQAAIDDASEQLANPPDGESPSSVKLNISRGLGAAGAVGVLCSVKSFGEEIPKYKYANVMMPVMRMGMRIVTMGNQVMSGDGFNLNELGAFKEALYDEEAKTSWTNARTIQAEFGQKQTGPDIPAEAKLNNINDKPEIFKKIDKVPFLDGACSASDGIFGLPVIKQVSGAVNAVTGALVNGVLSVNGTSTDKLMQEALSVASGNSVNLLSEGAELGNLANAGAFYGAADQATTMGGSALTTPQRAELRNLRNEYDAYDRTQKPVLARYFNPYDGESLVGRAVDASPSTSTEMANSLISPARFVSGMFSSATRALVPSAFAQTTDEVDYGAPKRGFSAGLQQDPKFENPIEIAQKVEKELVDLNSKYSKCFNMEATIGEDRVHIRSTGKTLNSFEIDKLTECDPEKNTDNLFNHYRFYLADAQTVVAQLCNDGDESACQEIGIDTGNSGAPQESEATGSDLKIKKLSPALPGAKDTDFEPKGITLHWWGNQYGKGIDALVDIFKSNGFSVQLGITSEGEVWQLTESLLTRTNHATGGNSTTIGIEIEGGPAEFGKDGIEKYPKKFEAVVKTVQYLKDKYNIPIKKTATCGSASGILQHSDFNNCPSAVAKGDVDDYYYNEVIKRIK